MDPDRLLLRDSYKVKGQVFVQLGKEDSYQGIALAMPPKGVTFRRL
jgi:hypothetical protein